MIHRLRLREAGRTAPDLRRSLQDVLAVRRIGCPFCERQDELRLTAVTVEGEGGLRIDYCEACGGYLKTYDGEGNESVLLADWTSLQRAASLYDL